VHYRNEIVCARGAKKNSKKGGETLLAVFFCQRIRKS